MTKKKIITIVAISVGILLIVLISIWYYRSEPSSSTEVTYTSDGKIALNTNTEQIEINDIYSQPVDTLEHNGVTFAQTEDYIMTFFPEQQEFNVAILNPDISQGRKVFEEDFLRVLGITRQEACKIHIQVGVPYSVNPTATTANYGLSFCPNGVPL